MRIINGMKMGGVPEEHEICLIAKIGCKEFLVLHRINGGPLEIKVGPLQQLHNGVIIKRESVLSQGRIIMTSRGVLDIPLPKNHKEIKFGETNRPFYDEEVFPTFMEKRVEILCYNLKF